MIKFNELFDEKKNCHNVNNSKPEYHMPWVDKYRPDKLSDVVHQDDVVKMLNTVLETGNLPHLLFHGFPGTGKCLEPNTPIIMFDGKIELAKNIKVNDKLMGDNNKPRTVLNTTDGDDIMYKIIQSKGDDYIVNSEHIISLKLSCTFIENEYKLVWFENHEIKEKSFTTHIDLSEYKQKLVNSNIINKKGDICDICIKDYMKQSSVWIEAYKGFKCDKITCWEKKQVNMDPYILGNTHKDIPDEYKINDVPTRLQLLAGFLDANGHLSKNNSFEFCEKSEKLFNDIIFVARSLGFMVSVIDNRAIIYGNDLSIIPTQKLVGKYKKYKRDPLTYNIKIQELKKGKYYGFTLDGNGRFLLGDFTITHNTSTILAAARQLFGPKKFRERVIELNASDERGINIVRNKIVTLAKMSVSERDPKYVCPPFKIIILDEADAMTTEAQSALRKTMEDYSSITRFCFICNYINQIITPITSRCVKFRFKAIDDQHMTERLTFIANNEKMDISRSAVHRIANISNGDMRKGIMLLQNLNYQNKRITIHEVFQIANMVPTNKLADIVDSCICNKNKKTIDIRNKTNELITHGYPINVLLSQLVEYIINCDKLTDKMKAIICYHISTTEKRLVDGADEYLQLLSVFMCINSSYLEITDSVYEKID